MPFSCYLSLKDELCIGPFPNLEKYYVHQLECNIDSFSLKISYTDLSLLI